MIRRFDDLGRIHIPKEIRKLLNWNENTAVEISVDGDARVILTAANKGECVFCHSEVEEEDSFMDVPVCKKCRERLGKEV